MSQACQLHIESYKHARQREESLNAREWHEIRSRIDRNSIRPTDLGRSFWLRVAYTGLIMVEEVKRWRDEEVKF